jgi:hypothetical protein
MGAVGARLEGMEPFEGPKGIQYRAMLISAEEKALLDAAKAVCRVFGQVRGKVITQLGREREAEALLAELVHAGRQVKDGQYVMDLP